MWSKEISVEDIKCLGRSKKSLGRVAEVKGDYAPGTRCHASHIALRTCQGRINVLQETLSSRSHYGDLDFEGQGLLPLSTLRTSHPVGWGEGPTRVIRSVRLGSPKQIRHGGWGSQSTTKHVNLGFQCWNSRWVRDWNHVSQDVGSAWFRVSQDDGFVIQDEWFHWSLWRNTHLCWQIFISDPCGKIDF